MKNNDFSIIIPVYNGIPFINHSIESVINQTYSNYNIIILDSGCSDNSIEFLKSLNNSKIIIHSDGKRYNIEENWGRILDVELNEFITILGQDDILNPNFLETINELIYENPEASLYHTHFNYINQEGKIIRSCKPMPEKFSVEKYTKEFLSCSIDSMGTGYVCRALDYKKVGGIPTNFPNLLFADFALWLNLTELSYQVISLKNCFAFRIHQSTTTTSSNEKYLNAFENFISFLDSKKTNKLIANAIEKYGINYMNKYAQGILHRLIKTPTNKRVKNETVKNFLVKIKKCQKVLLPNIEFRPYKNFSILLARAFDCNLLTRKVFHLFKSLFKKPILE